MTRPHLIGIAGASCSGKTTLARRLAAELGPPNAVHLALDSYYYDLSNLTPEQVDQHNLDEPAALDAPLLFEQVTALALGRAIDRPVYDHKTHARSQKLERVEPSQFVVLEGLFTLHWPEIRQRLATAVFIDTTHELCLQRRIERDRNQRGRTEAEVIRRYKEMVGPMYDSYVLPTREFADIVVDGSGAVEQAAAQILDHIRGRK